VVRRSWLAFGAVVVISIGNVAVGGLEFRSTTGRAISVTLTIAQAPSTGVYAYSAVSILVPRDSIVEFTVLNFDPTTHRVDPRYCNVTGTGDGMMGMGMGLHRMSSQRVGALAAGSVSHTFTMVGGGYDLNVPLPPALSPSQPSIVEFTLRIEGPGMMIWTCEVSGMGSPTGMPGTMMGGFTSQ
jgi:hypothetical protein